MKSFSQIGRIKDGKLELNRDEFAENIRETGEGTVLVTVEKISPHRSSAQNAYYWAVVLPKIAEGFSANGQKMNPKDNENLKLVHFYLKKRFLGEDSIEVANLLTGEVDIIKKISASRTLKKHEFEAYLQECRNFALEYFNIIIPLPNETL